MKTHTSQKGFTLIELVIAVFFGVFLFAGVYSVYVSMRASTTETLHAGELQETARIAIDIITADLSRAGFWGEDLQLALDANITQSPPIFVGDCRQQTHDNSASFPVIAAQQGFRYLFATRATQAAQLECIADAKTDSDVLQLKRSSSVSIPSPASFQDNRFYLMANGIEAAVVAGDAAVFPSIENSRSWIYWHRVYYVANTSDGVTLKRKQLIVDGAGDPKMDSLSLMEGIEKMRLSFGVDTNGDGRVDVYVPTNQMRDNQWQSTERNRIIAAKITLLARVLDADLRYENFNTYDLDGETFTPNGDHYRRLLMSRVIRIENSAHTQWHEGIR